MFTYFLLLLQIIISVLFLLSSSTPSSFFVTADVRCRTGEFAHSCPSEMPVCCFDASGFSTGCCREGTECTPNGDCNSGPPPPPNTSATELETIETVVHLSWTALVLTIISAIVALFLIAGAVFVSGQFRSCMARRRVELRARQLRETGHLSDVSDAAENDAENLGYEPDAEVTSDDEREYRMNVLSSEQAVLEHAIAEANRDNKGVMGRVSAWFKSSPSTKNMNSELVESPRTTTTTRKRANSISSASTFNIQQSNQQQQQVLSSTNDIIDNDTFISDERTHLLSCSSNKDDIVAYSSGAAAAATTTGTTPLSTTGGSQAQTPSQLMSAGGGSNLQQQQQQAPAPAPPAASSLPAADPTEKYLLANCTLCKIRLSNCTLLPCMHSSLCEDCAKHLKRCSECKTVIKKRVKIFTS